MLAADSDDEHATHRRHRLWPRKKNKTKKRKRELCQRSGIGKRDVSLLDCGWTDLCHLRKGGVERQHVTQRPVAVGATHLCPSASTLSAANACSPHRLHRSLFTGALSGVPNPPKLVLGASTGATPPATCSPGCPPPGGRGGVPAEADGARDANAGLAGMGGAGGPVGMEIVDVGVGRSGGEGRKDWEGAGRSRGGEVGGGGERGA